MGYVLLALMYLVPAAVCCLLILAIYFLAKALGMGLSTRRLVVGVAIILLLTPVWVPGALGIIPVPALLALVFGVVGGNLEYLLRLQTQIPITSITAIAVSILIAFCVAANIRDEA